MLLQEAGRFARRVAYMDWGRSEVDDDHVSREDCTTPENDAYNTFAIARED